jgi:hypothetical protein
MTDIILDNVKSGYNLSKINNNFEVIEENINNDVVHNKGGNNIMSQELDMNSNKITNLPLPIGDTEPLRKGDIVSDATGATVQYVDDSIGVVTSTTVPLNIINDLSQSYTFPTVAAYKAFTTAFPVGKNIYLQDREANFLVISGTAGGAGATFDLILSDAVSQSINIITNGTITLYQLGATFEGAAATQFQYALDTDKYTTVIVPDKVTIGKHEFNSSFKKTISGGEGVILDDAVVAAGIYPTVCGFVEIKGFSNIVMKTFPLTGGVVVDGHLFVGLGSGADIDTLIIRDNSGSGGRAGIAAGFENGRALRNRCETSQGKTEGKLALATEFKLLMKTTLASFTSAETQSQKLGVILFIWQGIRAAHR